MGRWSNERRAQEAAKAAQAASEAGRVLQQRQQAAAKPEPSAPKSEPAPSSEAPQRPDDWKPSVRNEPRRRAMQEIVQRDQESKGIVEAKPEEPVAPNPPPPTPEQMLEGSQFSQPDAAPPADSAVPQTPAAHAAEQAAAAPVKTVKVKVDGEESEVPESEVEEYGGIRPYQIAKAQENRLKKLNESLAESKRTQNLMAQLLARQGAPAAPAAPQLTDDEFIKSKVDVIRFGTPEESAVALREIMARGRTDPQAIIRQATQEMEHLNAVRAFDKEFKEIVSDPDLLQLVYAMRNQEIGRHQREQIPIDWTQFYSNIGNRVRAKFVRASPPAASPTNGGTPSQPDKEARKASIVNLPTAAGARAELPKEEKPKSREEILNQMRKARGLPTG